MIRLCLQRFVPQFVVTSACCPAGPAAPRAASDLLPATLMQQLVDDQYRDRTAPEGAVCVGVLLPGTRSASAMAPCRQAWKRKRGRQWPQAHA